MKPSLRMARAHLEAVLTPEEIRGLTIERGQTHYKGHVAALGMTFTIGCSLSDHRWFENWKSQLRRRLRAHREAIKSA